MSVRLLLALLLTLAGAALFGPPLAAQTPALAAAAAAGGEKKEEGGKLSDEQIKALVKTLEDPAQREAFIGNLKTMQSAMEAAKPPAEPPSMLALDAFSKVAADAGKNFSAIVSSFADVSQASRWFERQWDSEEARMAWMQIFIQALAALAAGSLVLIVTDIFLRRPRLMAARYSSPSLLMKGLVFCAYHLMALLPVIGFAAAALFVLNSFGMPARPEKAVTAILYGFISFQMVVWLLRLVFATRAPHLRPLPLDNEGAAYLYVWSQRLAGMIVFGYFLAQAALKMDMPDGSVHAFSSFVGLIVTVMVIIIILQNRSGVSAWLRGESQDRAADAMGGRTPGFWQVTRQRLSEIWHVLAIAYLCVGYLVATLDLQNGFGTLLRATIITGVTLLAFRFLLTGLDKLVARGFALPPELKSQFPLLEERTNSYLPILQRVLKVIAWMIAVLILLSAWGVNTAAWFATPFGKKVVMSGISISLTLFFSVVFWEIVNSFTDRMTRGTDSAGNTVTRSARMLTLMPLLRHTLHIVIVTVAVLIILSEVGVDITPLLAGAGIIGLAIGFGAQTLVKDFITGLFILLEDTIAVGDVVNVGDHSGVVEEITIRTLKLRDLEGRVHSIPFSEVTSVINHSKYFSFALIEVGVGYDADLRNVMQVMKAAADAMYNDPAWRSMIYEPMEILGVERFDASSIAVRGRIKTQPLKQWAVKREYLLRLKDEFDRQGIEIPFPITTTIHVAKDSLPPVPGRGQTQASS